MAVTDPKLIKELDELRLKNVGSNIKSSGETVNDPDLIKELDDIRLQNTLKVKLQKHLML
jgi:phage-related protein